jgi:gliding motility-associated-like protein
LNDVFYPQFYCQISDYNLEIFDRWGKSIYQTSNMNENWNGKLNSQLVPIGVYVYKVSYQSIIKGVNAKPSAFSGRVSVMY